MDAQKSEPSLSEDYAFDQVVNSTPQERASEQGNGGKTDTTRVSLVTREVLSIAGIIIIAACVLSFLPIGCPIKFATGLSCPGCGLSRAWFAALTLQPQEAFAFHPLFWTIPFALVAAVALQMGIHSKLCTVIVVTLLVLFFVLWVIRLFSYPDMELFVPAEQTGTTNGDVVGWSMPIWLEWLLH